MRPDQDPVWRERYAPEIATWSTLTDEQRERLQFILADVLGELTPFTTAAEGVAEMLFAVGWPADVEVPRWLRVP